MDAEAHRLALLEGGTGQAEIVNTPHGPVGRGTSRPGWRWSEHVEPIAGTASCMASHVAYVVSGRMTLTMDDGTSQQFGLGDLMIAAPGHDAEVDGDEPCVIVDWQGASDDAKRPVLSSCTRLSDEARDGRVLLRAGPGGAGRRQLPPPQH